MNWNLLVTGPAQKQLRRIPERDRERVEAALLAMQDEPFSASGRACPAPTPHPCRGEARLALAPRVYFLGFNFRLMTACLRESNELSFLGPLDAPR